jgi:hypothetical protein
MHRVMNSFYHRKSEAVLALITGFIEVIDGRVSYIINCGAIFSCDPGMHATLMESII